MVMRWIPVLRCRDLGASIDFYTRVLDFVLADDPSGPVVALTRDGCELHLSVLSGDGGFGTAVQVRVDDVDACFARFVSRGLDVTRRPDSPVHSGVVDQTWGVREFYVADPDGNTLRFGT